MLEDDELGELDELELGDIGDEGTDISGMLGTDISESEKDDEDDGGEDEDDDIDRDALILLAPERLGRKLVPFDIEPVDTENTGEMLTEDGETGDTGKDIPSPFADTGFIPDASSIAFTSCMYFVFAASIGLIPPSTGTPTVIILVAICC